MLYINTHIQNTSIKWLQLMLLTLIPYSFVTKITDVHCSDVCNYFTPSPATHTLKYCQIFFHSSELRYQLGHKVTSIINVCNKHICAMLTTFGVCKAVFTCIYLTCQNKKLLHSTLLLLYIIIGQRMSVNFVQFIQSKKLVSTQIE